MKPGNTMMIVVYVALVALVAYGIYYVIQFNRQSSTMKNYTAEQIAERRGVDTSFVLLDVRTDMERKRNRIDGSIHIPVGDLEERAGELEKYKGKEIVCYCQGGVRSVTAAAKLKEKGFNASNMLGGIADWNAKGLR